MPVDFTPGPDTDPTKVESDTPMFAPIRTSKKGEKRSFFSDMEPEARAVPPVTPPATGQRLEERASSDFAPPPTYAGGRATAQRKGMLGPMAIVGGLVLLAGVGAAGWYATQPHGGGLAQITPSDTSVTPVAPPADQLAQAPAPPPPEATAPESAKPAVTARAEPAPHTVRIRAHAAASPAAEDSSVNASAVVPAPARPVTPPVNALPPQAAPTPAPVIPSPTDTPAPPPEQSPTPPPGPVPPQ